MKKYLVGGLKTILLVVLISPLSVSANDYGGWFNTFSPVDCFIIDNLPLVVYPVRIIYSDEFKKNLGREYTIAETGKCYDTSSSILVLDGNEKSTYQGPTGPQIYERTFSPAGESNFHRLGTYLNYFDIGLDYAMFNSEISYKLEPMLKIIDNDFGKCDIRKRIETHITINKTNAEENLDSFPNLTWQADTGKQVWLLKDNTRKDAPTIPYIPEDTTSKEAWPKLLASSIGCYDTLQIYLNGKTQQLIKQYLQTPDNNSAENTPLEIKDATIKSVGNLPITQEKQSGKFQWWWPLVGAVVIGGAVIIGKKLPK